LASDDSGGSLRDSVSEVTTEVLCAWRATSILQGLPLSLQEAHLAKNAMFILDSMFCVPKFTNDLARQITIHINWF